jgi:hypothetical protein
VCAALCLLAACQPRPPKGEPVQAAEFDISTVAKSDGDMVIEINLAQSQRYLHALARKLYARNPNQLRRSRFSSQEMAVNALVGPRRLDHYPGLAGKRSAQAIGLAFDETYSGDRVAAFVFGMHSMLMDAYDGKQDFYVFDVLDPQKLYFLARNFEIAFWKLRHDRDAYGQVFLLSNSLEGNGNLSFERLAGKLIALQDLMAKVVADGSNRQIKNVIQRVTSAVFFPI